MIESYGQLAWLHVETQTVLSLEIQDGLVPHLDKIKQVVDVRYGEVMFGLNMVVYKGKTIFVGDTSVHEYPTSEQLAEIAISTARVVRLFGFDPKVAFRFSLYFWPASYKQNKSILEMRWIY